MDLDVIIGLLILGIIVLQIIIFIILTLRSKQGSQDHVLNKFIEYEKRLDRNDSLIRDEFGRNREESNKSAKDTREEFSKSITDFIRLVDNKITMIQNSLNESSKTNREELSKNISDFSDTLNKELKSVQDAVNTANKNSRDDLTANLKAFEEKSSARIENLTKETKDGLEKNRDNVEKKLAEIQVSNEQKLEKMRETVDEKLQKTLEARLGESFKQVNEQLENVYKGLGEMQNLASDVGDLKKVMSNVKTKGVLGEYQLEAILEQMLNPGQYEKNVKTKIGSDRHVEFAIKIPSKEDNDKPIWLPVDAKLPTSDYETLFDAYNSGDKKFVEDARKAFSRTVRNFAKEINEKYIDPPNTTDFAIMFLPSESAYAEVVRDPELFQGIQREHKIIVTGPSTIAAFLNALQIGFKSLNVEKRTGHILSLLSVVKKEFGTFESSLTKIKDQIDKASENLDETIGRRTKAMHRALKNVESSSDDTIGRKLLSDASSDFDEAE